LKLSIDTKLAKRDLERQIDVSTFERTKLNNSILSPLARELYPTLENVFKNNYVLEFLGLPEDHNESDLQKALIQNMKNFILELGKDFIFVSEEFRLQVGNQDFFIDLLFYHRGLSALLKLKCWRKSN
jgi:predicted nuclease of restriction endonuclease-like (RecB) superfamily